MPKLVPVFVALIFVTSATGADLVVQAVDASRLNALSDDRVAWATAANDLGDVADDLALSHLTIVLKRAPQQQRAFDEFLRQQQDPASPNHHRWLTPAQVGEYFGASAHDIDAVTSWLRSQALQVDAVAPSRTRIGFSGPAVSVGAAFGSRLHNYVVNGERRIAPAGVPRIPAALSAVVETVRGLATIDERSHHRAQAAAVDPNGTSCSGPACTYYVFPADFAAIYDVSPVYTQGVDGTGQAIAIIGRARVYMPDIEIFQSKSNLAAKDPVIIVPPNGIDPGPALSSGGDPGEQGEATLDVTRATSVASGATIYLVISAKGTTTSGLDVASQYVIDTHLAQVMSISFGTCEAQAGGQSSVAFWDSLFSQAAAQGMSVFVSSGDSGAAACDKHNAAPPASQVLSANILCASSHVTCVGGTQFADTANPNAYWSSSNGAGFKSALGYIPEGAWNEPLDGSGNPIIAATGGGVSLYVPTPSWQTGPGVTGTQGRYTPDVSFGAASHDGYFGCLAAMGASCVSDASGVFHFVSFTGTSASAPDMAGIAALLNQKMGGPQGTLNPRLYALAATPGNGVFHDVTVDTSGVVGCSVTTPSICNNSTPGTAGLSGGLAGFLVGPGYDLATGLGSIDVANLLANWSSSGAPSANYQGLWWRFPAASESGWGINFAHQGDTIFASWFTYDLSGYGSWLVMTANKTAPATYTGILYATTGPPFGSVPFDPNVVVATPVGTGTLAFADANNGTFAYSIGTTNQVKPLTREIFGPLPTCVFGDQPNLALATNYTDLWWVTPPGSESGWGINFNHQGDTIFATWFTYDSGGNAMWLVVTAPKASPGVYSGNLYQTKGPPFNAVPFDPSQVVATVVGTATITFANGNSAAFSYTVNTTAGPVTQTKQLVREVFHSPGTTCQ